MLYRKCCFTSRPAILAGSILAAAPSRRGTRLHGLTIGGGRRVLGHDWRRRVALVLVLLAAREIRDGGHGRRRRRHRRQYLTQTRSVREQLHL